MGGDKQIFKIKAARSGTKDPVKLEQLEKKVKQLHLDDINNFNSEVLCVVGKADEGVDLPDIATIILYSYTQSRVKIFQRMGRGLRLNKNKRVIHIIDLLGNYPTLKAADEFGIGPKLALAKKGPKSLYLDCIDCETKNSRSAITCITCGKLLRNQDHDSSVLGAGFSYSLGLRRIFGSSAQLNFPSELEETIKEFRKQQGLTEDEIIDWLIEQTEAGNFSIESNDGKELVSFPSFPYTYSIEDFITLLNQARDPMAHPLAWQTINSLFCEFIPKETTLKELYYEYLYPDVIPTSDDPPQDGIFFVDQKGAYYECENHHKTYEKDGWGDQFGCSYEKNDEECLGKYPNFVLGYIYPESLDLRLKLMHYYLSKYRDLNDEVLNELRNISGLGVLSSDGYDNNDKFEDLLRSSPSGRGEEKLFELYFPDQSWSGPKQPPKPKRKKKRKAKKTTGRRLRRYRR